MTNNTEWTAELRTAIEELNLAGEEISFRIHPVYRVGVSKYFTGSIPEIFGDSFPGRMKNFGRNLFKFPWGGMKFSAKLPDDTVIFFRENKKGLIASSQKENFVLKIFQSESHTNLLDEEITSLKEFQNTKFAKNVPFIKGDGWTSNKARWMLMEFKSNVHSLSNLRSPEDYLLNNAPFIMQPLFELYKTSGFKIIPIRTWLSQAEERIKSHPSREQLKQFIEAIREHNPGQHDLVQTRIHHDVHKNNVLVGPENQPVFIDWEGKIESLTVIDYFDLSRRAIEKDFWEFMRREKPASKLLKQHFDYYRSTSLSQFRAIIPAESHRAVYFIYALERSLLLYEKRKVDRLADPNGFEAKLLKTIQKI